MSQSSFVLILSRLSAAAFWVDSGFVGFDEVIQCGRSVADGTAYADAGNRAVGGIPIESSQGDVQIVGSLRAV